MSKSKVERLAEELFDVAHPGADVHAGPPFEFKRLARHVLARERRARGRTEGHIVIDTTTNADETWIVGALDAVHRKRAAAIAELRYYRKKCPRRVLALARVVLVPRRRKRK